MAKPDLVRFGVAIDAPLLEQFDALVQARGGTRSEVLRDLVRAELGRARVGVGVPAVASLTLVYNHHVRDLSERLTELQHRLGEKVRSTLHIHLDPEQCLEVIILQGRSDDLQQLADTLLATRGVTHGGIQIVPVKLAPEHRHDPKNEHKHDHKHEHRHDAAPPKKKRALPRAE
jgi:CopG family nickel-responsive transcriptional regulator